MHGSRSISLSPFCETQKLTRHPREVQMRQCKEAEEIGSGKISPELLLMNDDGEVVDGTRCTEDKCVNE